MKFFTFTEVGIVLNLLLPSGKKIEAIIPAKEKMHGQSAITDGVQSYAKRLLELGLLFKDMLDATKLPERQRWLRVFKLSMLFFKNHRNKSKYAYEIMRLLVHQVCILTEKAACEEFYGLFVNTNGHVDGHIAADQRMEYLVKEEKEHIKHMFSNKTEKNINMRSCAIAGMHDIALNFDLASGVVVRTQKHKDKSSAADEIILLEDLRRLRPFKEKSRVHSKFGTIRPSGVDGIDIQHYHNWIKQKTYAFSVELGN